MVKLQCTLCSVEVRQGNPISAFLFILILLILFLLIKTKSDIAELTIFDHYYLYFAYADDTTLFLQNTITKVQIWSMLSISFRTFLD